MQLANNITLSVYKAVYESCGPGKTNRDFTSLIDVAYARCGVRGEASCQVAAFSAQPHGSPTPQVIRENQVVLIDDGCFVQGYQSDISRSFVYGTPTDRQKRVFDIVHQAQSAALAAAHPGAEMQSVDAAARAVITNAGFGPGYKHFTHRVGHGIGMDMHEWYYLVRGNTQLLAPNMTFSDEPGIYLPDDPKPFGIRLEDDMHITEDGAKLFTPQSPQPRTPPSPTPDRAPLFADQPSTTQKSRHPRAKRRIPVLALAFLVVIPKGSASALAFLSVIPSGNLLLPLLLPFWLSFRP